MNCICDDFRFPPETLIPAGLSKLPRQTGTFAEFRRAMLRAVSIRNTNALETHPLWSSRFLVERDRGALKRSLEAIGRWRGRHPEDFGMMLLEMWSYVCDLISFYDNVLAHESYMRTALRRESLRKLVGPLGYIPRPAVAAFAELAAFADGRQVVPLPGGTAFRSGAFDGNPPQVFELTKEATIHPLLNEWTFLQVRPVFLPAPSAGLPSLLCKPGTVSASESDVVVVRSGSASQARRVSETSDYTGADGGSYVRMIFDTALNIAAGTAYSSVRLLKSSATASQWKVSVNGETAIGTNHIYLDSLNRQIRAGQSIVLGAGSVLQTLTVDRNEDVTRTLMPDVVMPVSQIHFTTTIDSAISAASPHIDVHFAFVEAGVITAETLTEISDEDPLHVPTPLEVPRDGSAPGTFQLEDKNGLGLTRSGSLNFAAGEFTVQDAPWPSSLVTPVRLFGNVITASRGETVNDEFLGVGDGAVPNQSFTLKKSPLTFLPTPAESTPSGLTSTLRVFVDGLQWLEVPSFFSRGPEEQIYIVRQNDKNESVVTFGDGILGQRLSTGANVVGYYRHGGGAAMPPAGSITQIAKPFKGLKSVRQPVAAFGGADAEPADSLRKYAPRSALLLGRAVSLADIEAAAASYSGVRAVATEWRWSSELQVPAAHIWYLADGDLRELLLNKLRSLTQPDTPIQVEAAIAAPATLSIQLSHDPRRFEADVLTAARTALMDVENGLLPPERLGIGKPLFRSRLFEFLINVPGVVSVTGLEFGSAPFSDFGIKPPAGYYFDFDEGLYLNGRNE